MGRPPHGPACRPTAPGPPGHSQHRHSGAGVDRPFRAEPVPDRPHAGDDDVPAAAPGGGAPVLVHLAVDSLRGPVAVPAAGAEAAGAIAAVRATEIAGPPVPPPKAEARP